MEGGRQADEATYCLRRQLQLTTQMGLPHWLPSQLGEDKTGEGRRSMSATLSSLVGQKGSG